MTLQPNKLTDEQLENVAGGDSGGGSQGPPGSAPCTAANPNGQAYVPPTIGPPAEGSGEKPECPIPPGINSVENPCSDGAFDKEAAEVE